jgi:2-succinyl-6-hydroxy-2,4-cyclohexadiene-1-carboxylate synthase
MLSIDILGIPHAYEFKSPSTQGDTPVLIFLHGWLLSRHYWQPLMAALAPNYTCLAYDLRGFGDSQLAGVTPSGDSQDSNLSCDRNPASPYSPYSLAAYAQDLIMLLDKLAIENAWLIGHSLGGSIALWGAYLCPERVQGVICLNAGGGIYLKEEFERFRAVGQRLVKSRPRWLMSAPLLDWLFARMMVARPLARQWGRQRVIDFVTADRAAALGTLLDSTAESEVHLLPQIVSQLSQSVYFIAGAEDKVMEPTYVNYLASFHPLFAKGVQNVFEIPHCGHLSMLEYPVVVANYLDEIIRRC